MTLFTVDNVYSMLGLEEEDSGSDPESDVPSSYNDTTSMSPLPSNIQRRRRTSSTTSLSGISDNYLLGETSKFEFQYTSKIE